MAYIIYADPFNNSYIGPSVNNVVHFNGLRLLALFVKSVQCNLVYFVIGNYTEGFSEYSGGCRLVPGEFDSPLSLKPIYREVTYDKYPILLLVDPGSVTIQHEANCLCLLLLQSLSTPIIYNFLCNKLWILQLCKFILFILQYILI